MPQRSATALTAANFTVTITALWPGKSTVTIAAAERRGQQVKECSTSHRATQCCPRILTSWLRSEVCGRSRPSLTLPTPPFGGRLKFHLRRAKVPLSSIPSKPLVARIDDLIRRMDSLRKWQS